MATNLHDLSKDQLVDQIKHLEHKVIDLEEKNESLTRENSLRKELFEFSPTPMWEEDVTELIEHLNQLKNKGINNFEYYFDSNPDELNECIKKIKLIDVNNATVTLHKAASKEHLISNLENLFTHKSLKAFKSEIIAIANGEKNFVSETNAQTFLNETIDLKLYLEIIEKTYNGSTKYFALVSTIDTTDLKSAESEIFNYEQSFNAILDASQDIIMLVDIEGNIIETNNTLLELFNLRKLDIVGRDISSLIGNAFRTNRMNIIDTIISSKKPQHCEEIILGRTWETSYYPVFNENNKVASIAIYQKDITQLLRSNKRIRESEKRLNLVLKAAKLGWWDYNFVNGKSLKSTYWFEMLGYSEDDVHSQHNFFLSLIHPDDLDRVLTSMQEHDMGVTDYYDYEHRLKHADGNYRWVYNWGQVIDRSQDGSPLRSVGVHMDITDKKISEEKAQILLESYSGIIDNALDAILILDSNGIFIDANKAASEIYGYSKDNLIGNSMSFLSDSNKNNLDELNKNINKAKQGNRVELEFWGKRKNGESFPTQVRMNKVNYLGNESIVAFCLDITERYYSEKKLRESEERYRTIFNQVPLSITQVDKDGNIIDINNFHIQHISKGKKSDKDFLGTNVLERETIRKAAISNYYKQLLNGKSFDLTEIHFPKTTGDIDGYYNLQGVPLYNESNQIGALITTEDVTQEVKARKKLYEAEIRLGLALDGASIAFWDHNLITNNVYRSDQWFEMLGYDSKDFDESEEVWENLIHPDDYENTFQEVRAHREGKIKEIKIEHRLKNSKGEYKWILNWGRVIERKNDGTPLRAAGIHMDISDRKAAEFENRKKQQELDLIYNSATDIMSLIKVAKNNLTLISFNNAFWESVKSANPRITKELLYNSSVYDGEKLFGWPKDYMKNMINNYNRVIDTLKEIETFEVIPFEDIIKYFRVKHTPIIDNKGICTHILLVVQDLTEQKKIEEKNIFLAKVLESSPLAYVMTDVDGKITDVNPALEELMGYNKDELIGQEPGIFNAEKNAKEIQDDIFKIIGNNQVWEGEILNKKKNGELFYNHSTIFPFFDGEKIIAYVGFQSDITERKLVEEKVKENEAYIRSIFSSAPIGIGVVSNRLFNNVNEKLCAILGYSKEELVGHSSRLVYETEDEYLRVGEVKYSLIEKYGTGSLETKWKRKDGKIIDILLSSTAIDKNDLSKGVTFSALDITEQNLYKKELEFSNNRYQSLFNNSPIALWEEDFTDLSIYMKQLKSEGHHDLREYFNSNPDEIIKCSQLVRIEDVNQEALNLHNAKSKEELLGNLDKIFTANSLEIFKEEVINISKGISQFECEGEVKTLDGINKIIYLRLTLDIDSKNSNKGILATIDITDRKLTEIALGKSEARLSTLMNNIPGMTYRCIADENWTMLFVNDASTELTGYNPEEIIQNKIVSFANLIHYEDREFVKVSVFEKLKTGEHYEIEYRIIDASGNHKWVWERGVEVESVERDSITLEGVIHDITSRKIAEEKLKTSERKFRALFENMNEGIFYQSSNNKLIDINDSCLEIFGVSKEEFLSRSPFDPIWHVVDAEHNKLAPEQFPQMESLQTGKEILDVEIGFKNLKTNQIRWLIVNCIPQFHYGDEKPFQVFVTLHDISSRKQMETNLKTTTQQLDLALKGGEIGIFYWDLKKDEIQIDKRLLKTLGYTKKEISILTLKAIKKFTHPEDLERNLKIINHDLSEVNNTLELEIRIRNFKGKWMWYLIRGKVLDWDINGKPLHITGTHLDITERIKTENKLRSSEEKHRALYENAPLSYQSLDKDGFFKDVNPAWLGILGYKESEVIGKSFSTFLHPDFKEHFELNFPKFKKKGYISGVHFKIRHKDGHYLDIEFEGCIGYAPDGSVRQTYCVFQDITLQKKAVDALQESETKFRTVYNNALIALFRIRLDDYKVIEANKVAADLYGYSTTQDFIDNFNGQTVFIQTDSAESLMARLEKKGYIEKIILRSQKKDGTYIWNESSFLLNNVRGYVDCFAVDSTDRILAQNKLIETNEKLRNLYRYMNNVREEERKNIAREVHDNLGQKLTALNLDISLIEKHVPNENKELKEKFEPIQDLINQSIVTVQRISTELRPGILDDLGLVNAIQWQSNEYSRRTDLKFNLNLADEEIELGDDVKTQLFRVYQEALTNIIRHSKAHNISVNLLFKRKKLIFEVIDDGEGIAIEKVNDSKSFGLIGMRERIASINGEIYISNRIRKGTIIKISVPLEEKS